MEAALIVNLLAAGIRSGTAILYATIGEIFAERAGVLNLGVEGMMLMGAVSAYGIAYQTGNPWIALVGAAAVGGALALIHAFLTVTLRADQVVSGLALTFLGSGLSAVLGAGLVEVRQAPRLPNIALPWLSDLPWVGTIFFQHNVFGAIRRLPLDMQNLSFFLRSPHLGYFLNMLPYLFTIVVLVLASREAIRRRIGTPAALGVPYVREERGL